jgi:hypothetical protein
VFRSPTLSLETRKFARQSHAAVTIRTAPQSLRNAAFREVGTANDAMSTAAAIPNPFVYGQVLIPGKPFCSRPQLESSVLEAAAQETSTDSSIRFAGFKRRFTFCESRFVNFTNRENGGKLFLIALSSRNTGIVLIRRRRDSDARR